MKPLNGIFEVKSVVKTIALCMLTVGLYVIYRLYTLTKRVNGHVKNPISSYFAISAIVVHLVSFFSLIIYFAASGSAELLLFSKLMHLISSIFHVTWLLKIRNRINELIGANKRSTFWLNPVLSSFLHVIYIQYKINQVLLANKAQQPVTM